MGEFTPHYKITLHYLSGQDILTEYEFGNMEYSISSLSVFRYTY